MHTSTNPGRKISSWQRNSTVEERAEDAVRGMETISSRPPDGSNDR